tara:strand:+ start:482 stop:964 length:483 start_codon:yes stop_codon:yes gene_type:complete
MNNLLTRDFHEALGKVIPVEMNDDLRLGNSLLDRIPTTQVQDLGINPQQEEGDIRSIDVSDLYTQLRFNVAETKVKLIEQLLIDTKDYWGLYDMYQDVPPYDKLPKLSLYAFCRGLVGKPMLKSEYQKINNDIKSIKKSMKALEKKNYKKTNGKYNVKFK